MNFLINLVESTLRWDQFIIFVDIQIPSLLNPLLDILRGEIK